jgi:hypothetical protein
VLTICGNVAAYKNFRVSGKKPSKNKTNFHLLKTILSIFEEYQSRVSLGTYLAKSLGGYDFTKIVSKICVLFL